MGKFVYIRWILSSLGVLIIAGCTTPTPVAVTKTEPPPAVVISTPTRPPTPKVEQKPTAPIPIAPIGLTAGPWVECNANEATVAVVVTVRAEGVFHERVGVHYLRTARPTTLRLVQLRSGAPTTLEQRKIPQACSATFHLTNNDVYWNGTRYSIHSTLKQVPVDPTHAITLNLSVRWQQSDGEKHLEQSQVLNGLNHVDINNGILAASVDIVPPSSVPKHIPAPPRPDARDTATLIDQLKSRYPGIEPLHDEPSFATHLPAKFHSGTGLSGDNLHLYPDHSYIYTTWADVSPEAIEDEGEWSFSNGLINLESSPSDKTNHRPPLDLHYLAFNFSDEKDSSAQPALLGTNWAFGNVIERSVGTSGNSQGVLSTLKSSALTIAPSTDGKPACPPKEDLRSTTGTFEAWSLLTEKLHLSYRNGSRQDGMFILTGDASVQFADVVFASDTIEISSDHSLIKLHGPVRIEWDSRALTATDAIIHVSPDVIQFESSEILPRR